MNKKTKNILIITLSIVVALLALRLIFDKKIDNFSRYIEERENYEEGPEAFDKNLKALNEWIKNYKVENPGSSDQDASDAFDAAWGK